MKDNSHDLVESVSPAIFGLTVIYRKQCRSAMFDVGQNILSKGHFKCKKLSKCEKISQISYGNFILIELLVEPWFRKMLF